MVGDILPIGETREACTKHVEVKVPWRAACMVVQLRGHEIQGNCNSSGYDWIVSTSTTTELVQPDYLEHPIENSRHPY